MANSSVDGGFRPSEGAPADAPAGAGLRPTTVCNWTSSRRCSASECQTPIMPWPTMQTLSIGVLLPGSVVGSTAEAADRHTGDVDPDGEDPAGQRLRLEDLRGEVVPQ